MKNIVIGGAWPYANGSLHIGHLAGLLPGDILARYHRAKGNQVFYVSGSDCHGTPITIRAKQENSTPEIISEHYHNEFCEVFEKLGFSYDIYTKTSDEKHKKYVTDFHKKLYESDYVKELTVKQAFCPNCQKVLTDRLVVGTCPVCKAKTRGDQCEACGEVLEADTILDAKCSECCSPVKFGETTQMFLLISKLKNELINYLHSHPYWRKNAVAFTKRYIDEGLRDRAITRDLEWGIDVPRNNYEKKKIYIWAENVLGYLSATHALCQERGIDFETVYGNDSYHYYVHGKDNIPFHTIVLPSLLLAHGEGLHLPDEIISSEYMTLEGRKISTSQNWAIWAKDLISKYDPDTIRYFIIANGPEKKDSDFSFREFKKQNNAELVGVWGNFVNRTLAFVVKYLNCEVPRTSIDNEIEKIIERLYENIGAKIERGFFRDAIDEVFEAINFGNTYYDAKQPWKTRTEALEQCKHTIANCVYLIGNIAVLLYPFLPFTSSKVAEWLGITFEWHKQDFKVEFLPNNISLLFSRINDEQLFDNK